MTHNEDDALVFLPLGGSGEIGMNFNAYGFGPPGEEKWIIADCGVLFGREGAAPGVDVIVPDVSFLAERRADVLGLIATHGHEDHIGAIPHLWPDMRCPIYATPFTARLIGAKLAEAGLTKAKLNAVPLKGRVTLGPFEIEFVTMTHSIPEPNALAIHTPLGTVVHSGDWKIDDGPLLGENVDMSALQRLGDDGVLALVCDSTNVMVMGHSGSEADVRVGLNNLIATLKGRVAVTAFASNVARLETVAKAAVAAGRRVVLVGRAMHKMVDAAQACGYLKDFPKTTDEEAAGHMSPDTVLYLCTGSQGEPRAAMARIATGDHPYVKLGEGDKVIFSSRVIPGNELGIFAMQNHLTALGVEVLSAEDHFVHVSGHPAQDDIKQLYGWLRPKIAIPVHGELRHQSAHVRLAHSLGVKTVVPGANGQMLRLAPGPVEVVDEVPSGRIHVDGSVLVPEGEGLARLRRSLSYAGLIAISLVLDDKGRIAAEPTFVMEGIPEIVQSAVRDAVDAALRRYKPKRDTEDALSEAVRRAARGAADDAWNKKPITRVVLTWL
ncbi:MAG: ribonuclease J [Rhizomicrobium sp.]